MFYNRIIKTRSQFVALSHLLYNFTVNHKEGGSLSIMSVFNDKLLVGFTHITQLLVIKENLYCSFIQINNSKSPADAIWTPRGNIAYTMWHEDDETEVVVMSECGKIIVVHTKITYAERFSVSYDEIIYLTGLKGVYESKDDGISWKIILKSTGEVSILQAIKVTTDHTDEYWILSANNDSDRQKLLYAVNVRHSDNEIVTDHIASAKDKRRFKNKEIWRNINITTINGSQIELSNSMLVFDGNMNIFLSDVQNKAVHVFLVNGQYLCQLLSSLDIEKAPSKIYLNRKHQLLYLGQENGVVKVYKMMYGYRV